MTSVPVVRADDAIGSLVAALRRSDELTAHAVDVLADLMPSGGIERVSGLPAELLVSLEAGRPAWEARALCEAASSLRAMPRLRAVFGRGEVSWALVRSVVAAVRRLDVEARARIDAVIADLVAAEAEPEVVLERVDDLVASMRADLSVATADRRIEAGFVSLQPFVDGSGGSVFAQADAVGFATICEAIDAHAPRPSDQDEDDLVTRGRQRLEGLVGACAASLGEGSGKPARNRVLAIVDQRPDAIDGGDDAQARLLWRARGRPGRLSSVDTQMLVCDARVQSILFDGARPIGIGEIIDTVSARARERWWRGIRAVGSRGVRCLHPGVTSTM